MKQKYGARTFNQKSYDTNDSYAKNKFIRFIECKGHTVLSSEENYDHDVITEKDGVKHHFELEVKRNYPFTNKESYRFIVKDLFYREINCIFVKKKDMSIIRFQIKEEHLKLLKHLQWSQTETNHLLSISSVDNDDAEEVILTPFGGDDLLQDIGDILYGKPEDFDPFDEDSDFGKVTYTDEQNAYMTELFNGITTALDICLYTQSFVAGHYKRKYHDRHWVKYEPKK